MARVVAKKNTGPANKRPGSSSSRSKAAKPTPRLSPKAAIGGMLNKNQGADINKLRDSMIKPQGYNAKRKRAPGR